MKTLILFAVLACAGCGHKPKPTQGSFLSALTSNDPVFALGTTTFGEGFGDGCEILYTEHGPELHTSNGKTKSFCEKEYMKQWFAAHGDHFEDDASWHCCDYQAYRTLRRN